MNERILEFAMQANFGYVNKKTNEVEFDPRLEKFAELIVRDCLSNMENGDLDFAIWKTKKDFGVE